MRLSLDSLQNSSCLRLFILEYRREVDKLLFLVVIVIRREKIVYCLKDLRKSRNGFGRLANEINVGKFEKMIRGLISNLVGK